MRITAYIIFSLTLILAGCLIMGCSSLPFPGGQPQETPAPPVAGFSSGNIPYEPITYNNFDDALDDLVGMRFSGSDNSNETEIRYILGTGIDSKGDASSWIFAVDNSNTTSLVTYGHNGRSITTGSVRISGSIIATNHILTPRQLFKYDRDVIFANQNTNETLSQKLVLEDGNYTISQSGQGISRTLIFNATTGVQIALQG
jgi:hypothetical protein